MRLRFDRLPLYVATLVSVTAAACGSHTDDVADGGTGGATASGGTGGTSSTGGSGGVGGSTTGGSGGASGSAGSGTGGSGGSAPGDSGICGCVNAHVGWGMNGGRVAYQDSSALEICNLFVHQRLPAAQSPPTLSCEQQLTDCVGKFGPADVTRAISNADVLAAIAAAPVLYGEDPRPADGAVLRIQIGSATIEVGEACRAAGCKPIPAGVSALATLLQAIAKQELSREPCRSVFPPQL